jgi:archaemetzincin
MKLDFKITILPIGEVSEKTLRMLKTDLEDIFKSVGLLKPIDLIESAYSPARNQYLSTEFLARVKTVHGNHVLGVTEVDLYTQKLNFVFGQAQLPGKAAVISLNRLHSDDRSRFSDRMLKEAVHELGHTFGLHHCEDKFCVMHFSNSLMDTDIKSSEYCEKCQGFL